MKITDKILNEVVTDCNMQYGICPFGCGKDGGPNCHQNIKDLACPPAKNYAANRREGSSLSPERTVKS